MQPISQNSSRNMLVPVGNHLAQSRGLQAAAPHSWTTGHISTILTFCIAELLSAFLKIPLNKKCHVTTVQSSQRYVDFIPTFFPYFRVQV